MFLRLPLYRNNAIDEIAHRLNRRFSSATIIVFRRCESSKISKRIKAPEVDIVVARAHRDVLFSTAAQLSYEFLGNTYPFRQLRFDFGYIRPFCHASIRVGIKIVIADRQKQLYLIINCSLREGANEICSPDIVRRGQDISQGRGSFRLIRRKRDTSRDAIKPVTVVVPCEFS